VNLLLAHGADVNAQTAAGQTPLMEAALNGRTDIVKTLLRNSANPNAQETTSGYTALMLASMKDHAEIVTLLLDHGADVNAQDKQGNTALTFARLESKRGMQWRDIAQLLEKAGAKE
jgi:ankyrin repeat protein